VDTRFPVWFRNATSDTCDELARRKFMSQAATEEMRPRDSILLPTDGKQKDTEGTSAEWINLL
jgi:hypothetical protein